MPTIPYNFKRAELEPIPSIHSISLMVLFGIDEGLHHSQIQPVGRIYQMAVVHYFGYTSALDL